MSHLARERHDITLQLCDLMFTNGSPAKDRYRRHPRALPTVILALQLSGRTSEGPPPPSISLSQTHTQSGAGPKDQSETKDSAEGARPKQGRAPGREEALSSPSKPGCTVAQRRPEGNQYRHLFGWIYGKGDWFNQTAHTHTCEMPME